MVVYHYILCMYKHEPLCIGFMQVQVLIYNAERWLEIYLTVLASSNYFVFEVGHFHHHFNFILILESPEHRSWALTWSLCTIQTKNISPRLSKLTDVYNALEICPYHDTKMTSEGRVGHPHQHGPHDCSMVYGYQHGFQLQHNHGHPHSLLWQQRLWK